MTALNLVDPASATGKNAELFTAIKGKLGLIPNMTRAMANSTAVLESYLGFSGALGAGKLPARLREQIALLVAEVNRCSYCLSAHTAIGGLVGLKPEEAEAAREGGSSDVRARAALTFAKSVLINAGAVGDEQVARVRAAGFSDGEIAEIIAHVGLNVFTNFFNKAAGVPVDFPVVLPRAEAAAV